MIERRFGHAQIILAAHREDDAAARQLCCVALEGEEGFATGRTRAEVDAVYAIVTDHAAPQGVVQVQHQAFARQTDAGGRDASQLVAIQRRQVRADQLLGLMPAHRFGQAVAITATGGFPGKVHQ